MISFKWRHFKKDMILMLVRWYLAYSLSYRDVEELALERGLKDDHSTINRWFIEYAPLLEETFRKRYKRPIGRQIKYPNNIVEQDHRFIKKITKTMKGFKAVHSADAT